MKHGLFFSLFLCVGTFLWAGQETAEKAIKKPSPITIDESRTSVFWYAVFLKVEDIVEEGDQLFSSYSIRLPSRSKDDEGGKVTFKLEKPLREIMTQGGKIQGVGISTNPKHPHREILCEFRPDSKKTGNGRVRMTIDTKERVLRFDSTYRATATE